MYKRQALENEIKDIQEDLKHKQGDSAMIKEEAVSYTHLDVYKRQEDVYAIAEMIIKVKEPIECEYNLVRKSQLVFTYFHFACDKEIVFSKAIKVGKRIYYLDVKKNRKEMCIRDRYSRRPETQAG